MNQTLRILLKRVPGVSRLSAFWRSCRTNPDVIELIERKMQPVWSLRLDAPTPEEAAWIAELRAGIRALPMDPESPTTSNAERKWRSFKNELRCRILEDDPRGFLAWDVVRSTMGGTLSRRNYLALTHLPFWPAWRAAFELLPFRYQEPYFKLRAVDGTTLAHAHTLAEFNKRLGHEVHELEYMVDFGGGYGSMCAAAHALGFNGTYVLFDWPEFLLLQKFYLQMHGIPLDRIRFVSSIEQLQSLALSGTGLLVATWSLSETPRELRETFLASVAPTYYVLAYQLRFAEVDNTAFFTQYAAEHPEVRWLDYAAYGFPGAGNRYMLGARI